MCGEAINSTLWELLAAGFASVFITIARIVQFRTSLEVLEDQSYIPSVSESKDSR